MDRVPYRRVSPPRNGTAASREYDHHENENAISPGETLIMQCIICGIIMVFVLIAGLTDIAPAVAIRGGISQVLTGAETLDELMTDVRRFGAEWFGWEPVEDDAAPGQYYAPAEYFDPPATNFESAILPTDYEYITDREYIDEYINETPAADQQVSNPAVPEPPVTPGLWD